MKTKPSKISKILSLFLVCFLVVQILVGMFWVLMPAEEAKASGASWYNSSWLYRTPITVDNTSNGNDLTNYQVQVSVTYDSDMQNDFDDIRFTDSNGTTLIDHWRETYTTSTSATFWVEVPTISASSTATIYMYYGNSGTNSTSNGMATFEERGFDDFEHYNSGSLVGQAPAFDPWSEYAGNPVLSTQSNDGFSSVFKDGETYHMYYSWGAIKHATSSDGLTWAVDTANNPVLSASQAWEGGSVGVPSVWKEGSTWYMLYRGGSPNKTGLATSSDGISWTKYANNPVHDDEVWGVIKVGSTYYAYFEGGSPRQIDVATSADLITWVDDPNNPIFSWGRFCPFPFKYGDYYYILVPHYITGTDYSQIELYRDTAPTFYPNSRELVRTAINYGVSGTWNDLDQDTPWVLTDDIYRNSFEDASNQLWVYFAGASGSNWYTGLAIETDIATALEKVDEPALWDSSSGTITAVSTTTRQGVKAIKQSDTSVSSRLFFTNSFEPKITGAMGAWVQKSNTGSWYYIYLKNSTTLVAAAGFADAQFSYWNGAFNNTGVAYLADTWYLLILEFNTNTDTYNFVVYDTSLNELLRQNNISFGNVIETIDIMYFITGSTLIMDGHIDDFRLRQYSSPEPSASTGTEEGYPITPTIGTPTVLSATSIRWNFTDNCSYETGFKLYDNNDTLVSTNATADLTYIDETGLSENTQYTGRYIKAYNSYGNSSASATSTAIYTLPDAPTNLAPTAITNQTITLSVDSFPNATLGLSGYYFYQYHDPVNHNSGWMQTNTWQNTGLSCGTKYTYYIKYRNVDGAETATSTLTTSTSDCPSLTISGHTPTPAPTTQEPTEEEVVADTTVGQATITVTAGGTTEATTDEGTTAKLEVPSEAVTTEASVTITPAQITTEAVATQVATFPKGQNIVGGYIYNYAMTSAGETVSTFEQAVTVTLTYTDEQISDLIENTLTIHYYDESLAQWIALETAVDGENNTATATTTHFTLFAIVGEPKVEKVATKPITEMTIEELKAKILEIQQQIIELITQLIQLIQGQIFEFQSQLL